MSRKFFMGEFISYPIAKRCPADIFCTSRNIAFAFRPLRLRRTQNSSAARFSAFRLFDISPYKIGIA
jgi:hypothetical protein